MRYIRLRWLWEFIEVDFSVWFVPQLIVDLPTFFQLGQPLEHLSAQVIRRDEEADDVLLHQLLFQPFEFGRALALFHIGWLDRIVLCDHKYQDRDTAFNR